MKQMLAAIMKKLGVNRDTPRLYLEGAAPERAGFTPGVRYTLDQVTHKGALVLRLDTSGARVVSRKDKGGRSRSVIDLNSFEALAVFAGMESVRVLIGVGEIWILPLAVEVKRQARLHRLRTELAAGQISTAAIAHGVGVMTHAMHQGLADAGLEASLRWAVEIEEDALNQAQRCNPAWSRDTLAVAMPLQQVALADDFVRSHLVPVSLLEAGLPCTAASVAGRSKKHLAKAEDDGKAGHLVVGFLALLARANPAVMVLENVVPYFNTASAAILRTSLVELGYDVQEITIDGGDYALEARTRKALVAITHGVTVNLAALLPPPRTVTCVAQILDPIAADDPCWSTMAYLKEKEVRDTAAGKGFRMAVVGSDATRVGTIGTGYQKNRSTEPKVPHPTRPDLLRLFTPAEHARLKGVPEGLIAGIESATRAHELLGQSVIWPAFRHLGEFLGCALRQHVRQHAAISEQIAAAA